jgi:hypothetical protein
LNLAFVPCGSASAVEKPEGFVRSLLQQRVFVVLRKADAVVVARCIVCAPERKAL